jgi:hypothetical protein
VTPQGDAVRNARVLEAIIQSSAERRTVTIN